MKRLWLNWLVFVLCLVVATTALGWMSLTMLQLERAETQAARQSENERLALWRMDSALVPLISTESGRPPAAYQSFYETHDAYSKGMSKLGEGEVQVPSSLLALESPHILLHFVCPNSGALSSPQVPPENLRSVAEDNYTTCERIEKAARELDRLASDVTWDRLAANLQIEAVTLPDSQTPTMDSPPVALSNAPAQPNASPPQPDRQMPEDYAQAANPFAQQVLLQNLQQQSERSYQEFQKRNAAAGNTSNFNGTNGVWRANALASGAPDFELPPMKGLWIDDSLVLVRYVRSNGNPAIQGCLLDWPGIRDWLRGEVADLLPKADLVPVISPSEGDAPLMLASLPLKLVPGRVKPAAVPLLSPMRISLSIAWVCLALAAAAVASLLFASMRLSERRGAFVSAVTHELRTPLTTFRLYSEMLAEGIVPTEEKRRSYLQTLRVEAERLGHLVENVLSYARLERSAKPVLGDVNLTDLLSHLETGLRDRAARSEMELLVRVAETPLMVRGDAAAIERILFNLVDNACKYAVDSEPRRIEIDAGAAGPAIEVRVRDYGKGVAPADALRLFRPFSKSAQEAAHSAPGVGLGLALCRRLARSMRGDLRIDATQKQGACFVLTLPRG